MSVNDQCKLCRAGVGLGAHLSQRQMAEMYGVGKSSVARHRKHLGESAAASGQHLVFEQPEADATVNGDPRSLQEFLGKYGIEQEQLDARAVSYQDPDGGWVKFAVNREIEKDYEDVDPVDILNRLEHPALYGDAVDGEGAFVVSVNDTQIGKAEGGGTDATLARVKRYVELAKQRIEELRAIGRKIGTLVIIGGGDILEGCFIYPNHSFNIDRHRHDQITAAVALVLHVIDQLSPMFKRVQMLVTKGNHGENRVDGRMTHAGDNDDTLIFKMAKNATDRDPGLQHLEWTIAEGFDEFVTVQVADTPWVLGTTHGDVYGKTNQQANSKKVWEWYKNMRAGRYDIGSVDVLITHHFHHEEAADFGSFVWRQTTAQDGGSKHFEAFSGQYSEPGMLSFVMTPSSRYQDELILR